MIGAVPIELVLAAGAVPVVLAARADDFTRSAEPMEGGMEAETRSLFLQAVTGEWRDCDLVVIASTSDGYRYLYQYLKEMVRTGEGDSVPPLVPFDLLFGDSEPVRRYSRKVFVDLGQRLAMLTGRAVGASALEAAVVATEQVRSRLRSLAAVRRAGGVAGSTAFRDIAAGRSESPTLQARRLDALLATATSNLGPRLLLVSAVPLYHDRLHGALEEAGCVVVAEDDGWTPRPDAPAIGSGDMDAIVAHYRRWAPSPRQPSARLDAAFDAMLEGGAEGVVFYVPPEDQVFGWRYPVLARRAEAAGMPTLLLRDEVLDDAGRTAIAAAAATFVSGLERAA